jgi:hypothetical protein
VSFENRQVNKEETCMSAPADSAQDVGASRQNVRFTLFIPEPVYRNFQLYCLTSNHRKQQVALTALMEYLSRNGMEPENIPEIKYSYQGRSS